MTDIERVARAIELKPCPCCGGVAEMDTQQGYTNYHTGRHQTGIAVFCRDCGLQAMLCRGDIPNLQPEEVVAIWNTRPQEAGVGWRMVPVEPSPEAIKALEFAIYRYSDCSARDAERGAPYTYAAMLAASPYPPTMAGTGLREGVFKALTNYGSHVREADHNEVDPIADEYVEQILALLNPPEQGSGL